MKTEFLSNVSHDMRTPLNGVIGYTKLAINSSSGSAMRDYLLKIMQSGEVLLQLINDTLDLSKIETGNKIFQGCSLSSHDIDICQPGPFV